MTTKQLDRLMFVQGDHCFFCKQPLSKEEASVEHLLASSNGGNNHDDNCVACCKTVNALFGNMSLKEKFQVILNQKGYFKCPRKSPSLKVSSPKEPASVTNDKLTSVIGNLKQRGNSKPRTLKTLKSTISSLFPKGISGEEVDAMIQELQSDGKVLIIENKVSYSL